MLLLFLACSSKLPVIPGPPMVRAIEGFNADPAHRGTTASALGTDPRVAWTAELGIQGWHNSPLVVGDTLFVGTYGGTWNTCDERDGVHRLNRLTGQVEGFWPTRCDTNGISSDGDSVYAVTDGGEVIAWGLDGVLKFRVHPTEGKLYAAPVPLGKQLLVSGSGGFVALLDSTTGDLVRRIPASGTIRNHSVAEGHVVWGTEGNHVGICTLDGTSCTGWTSKGDDSPIYGAPAIEGGQVAVPGGYDGSLSGEQLALLDLQTGSKLWSHAHAVGTKASPVLTANLVLFAESGYLDGTNPSWDRGRLYAYERATGEERWNVGDYGGSWSSPVVANDRVLWIPAQGPLLVLDTQTGEVRDTLVLGTPIHATPAVFDGWIYVGSDDGTLYGISTTMR